MPVLMLGLIRLSLRTSRKKLSKSRVRGIGLLRATYIWRFYTIRLHQMLTQFLVAALIPDERWVVLAHNIFFFPLEIRQAISGTSAATYKLTEPH